MKKIIETQVRGLKCDNPNCDWIDTSVLAEDYPFYVDVKCPKCGEVLLTKADCKAVKKVLRFIKFVNLFSFLVKDKGERTNVRLGTDGNGNVNVLDISEADTTNNNVT